MQSWCHLCSFTSSCNQTPMSCLQSQNNLTIISYINPTKPSPIRVTHFSLVQSLSRLLSNHPHQANFTTSSPFLMSLLATRNTSKLCMCLS